MRFEINFFDLEDLHDCQYDHLRVYRNDTKVQAFVHSSVILLQVYPVFRLVSLFHSVLPFFPGQVYEICGSGHQGKVFELTGSEFEFEFDTDGTVHEYGFDLSVFYFSGRKICVDSGSFRKESG